MIKLPMKDDILPEEVKIALVRAIFAKYFSYQQKKMSLKFWQEVEKKYIDDVEKLGDLLIQYGKSTNPIFADNIIDAVSDRLVEIEEEINEREK